MRRRLVVTGASGPVGPTWNRHAPAGRVSLASLEPALVVEVCPSLVTGAISTLAPIRSDVAAGRPTMQRDSRPASGPLLLALAWVGCGWQDLDGRLWRLYEEDGTLAPLECELCRAEIDGRAWYCLAHSGRQVCNRHVRLFFVD